MKTSYILIYGLFLTFCLSCEESPSPYPDRIKLLTNNGIKKWTIITSEYPDKPLGVDCGDDDILTLNIFDPAFNEGEGAPTFSFTDGFLRCEEDYEYSNGSWRMNNNQTRLILTEGEGEFRYNYLYDIMELSERRMVLRYRSESYSDLAVTYYTYTYESR
jgi:hypothetical protein